MIQPDGGGHHQDPNSMMMSNQMMTSAVPGTIYHNGVVYHPNQQIVYNGTTMMVPNILTGQIVTAPPTIPGGPVKRKMMVSKNDKRRHYAKMYAEAFNSGESKALLNFFESYCTPDCIVIQRCVVKENPFIPKYVEIHGIQAIHEFWTQTFITIPDCLIVMLETKLRIRNNNRPNPLGQTTTATANGADSTGTGANGIMNGNPNGVSPPTMDANSSLGGGALNSTSAASNQHLEGSSIVCSFSFTGTKIYTMTMEGAVLHPEGTVSEVGVDGNPVNGSATTAVSSGSNGAKSKGVSGSEGTVQALITKSQQRANKKRAHNAEWPANASGAGDGVSGASSAAGGVVSHPEPSSDRYNIFLHPPRRFSTLAGTPYGGNASHYTHHSSKQKGSQHHHSMVVTTGNGGVSKVSDFVSIDANTKFKTGQLTEKEGFINFLGTLTMYLDSNNKISKFEFLYSNFD